MAGLSLDEQLTLVHPGTGASGGAGRDGLIVQRQVAEANEERGSDAHMGDQTAYEVYGEFRPGAREERPELRHDHGFLDDGSGNLDLSRMRPPTAEDREALGRWSTRLMGADFLAPELEEAAGAYRHYLTGHGAPRHVEYAQFLAEDSSGVRVLESATADAMTVASEYYRNQIVGGSAAATAQTFELHSMTITVGDDSRYPYPSTQNWQKAIGGHTIWLDCFVRVVPGSSAEDPTNFFMVMTVNMEDMYNFNPGSEDLATGVPDDENGRFQVTGLAHEYLQTGSVTVFRTWELEEPPDRASLHRARILFDEP